MEDDICPFCSGLLHHYTRRDYGIDDEGQRYYDMENYDECENCNRESTEAGDYDGVLVTNHG